MTAKTLAVQKRTAMEALVSFHKESDNGIAEIISFPVPKTKRGDKNALQLPLGKTLRGSMLLTLDPDDEHFVLQGFRIYRKNTCKRTATIHETRYSRVIVSNTRVTVSMSFPLTDDPTRLTARLQNFANAIVDESDEIAAMLNQEGDSKVQEAWQYLNQSIGVPTSCVSEGGERRQLSPNDAERQSSRPVSRTREKGGEQ